MLRYMLGLGLCVALAASAAAEIKIVNIKARHGHRGPERESLDAIPGDEVLFSFLLTGVLTDANGALDLDLVVRVSDANGKQLLENKTPIKERLAFGGGQVPSYATVNIGPNTPPGKYVLTVTVSDKLREEKASFERTINCVKPKFAIIRPRFSYDKDGTSPAAMTNTLGQQVYFRLMTAGFDRSQKKIRQVMTVQFYDDKGKELMLVPLIVTAASNNEDEVSKALTITFNGSFSCNRAGVFKLKFTIRDEVNDQSTSFETTLKVLE